SFTRRLMLRPFLGLTSQITVDGQFSPLRCSIATLGSRVRYPTRIAIAARATTRRWPIDVTHHHCPLTQRAGKCIGDGTPVARPSCVTTDKYGRGLPSKPHRPFPPPRQSNPRFAPPHPGTPAPCVSGQ